MVERHTNIVRSEGKGLATKIIVNGIMTWTATGSPNTSAREIIGIGTVITEAMEDMANRKSRKLLPAAFSGIFNGTAPHQSVREAFTMSQDIMAEHGLNPKAITEVGNTQTDANNT